MTNGGGASEEDRSKRLSEQLGFEVGPKYSSFRRLRCCKITTSNFMQSHTILKSAVHKYADKPVLVLGGKRDILRNVAERCER
jgi:ribonucleotide monophosphatase NagD (HAD superfamily)